jgi:hypothetical protein
MRQTWDPGSSQRATGFPHLRCISPGGRARLGELQFVPSERKPRPLIRTRFALNGSVDGTIVAILNPPIPLKNQRFFMAKSYRALP